MARLGMKRRLDLGTRYWQLILSGVGTVEACQIVGIGRKTGYRWRAGNGGVSPVRLVEEARWSRCLTLLERRRIATLREQALSMRAIADRLGRAASTVSREWARNTSRHDCGRYGAGLAHNRARLRAQQMRPGRLIVDPLLRAEVQSTLELEWSPEQIVHCLRRAFPDRPEWHVSHETIYQALYHSGKGGLSRKLTTRLRIRRPLRKQRRRPDRRRSRFVPADRLIEYRSPAAHERARIGDGEGDLIMGRGNLSAVATLVDRAGRYLRLVHLPDSRSAEAVRVAIVNELFIHLRLTLTWDQGSEMACNEQLAHLLSGFRGIHRGRVLRSPRKPLAARNQREHQRPDPPTPTQKTALSIHTAEDLRAIEQKLNHRPRKTLGWHTPLETFHQTLAG